MKRLFSVLAAIVICSSLISAQSKINISAGGSFLSPISDFGDLYDNGFGGSVAVMYSLNDNFQLSLNAGYMQFTFNNAKFNQMLNEFYSQYGQSFNVNVDSKFKIIPIMLGGKYYFTKTIFRPYAALDLGLHIVSVAGSTVQVNGQTVDALKSESKAATAWGVGVGFLYSVTPAIGIDVQGKLNGNNIEVGTNFSASSGGNSSSQSSNSTVIYFSIAAGIVFAL